MATPHSLLSKALGPSEFQQLQEFYAYHPGLPAPHQRAGAGAPPPAAGRAKPRKTPSAGARRAAEAKRREEIYRGFDGSLYQHGHMAAAGQASQKQPAGHVHLTPDQFMHQQHAMGRMPPPASHPALQPPPPSGWASLLTTPPAHVPARRQPPAPQEPVFTGDEPRANKRVPLMVDKLVPEAAIYKRLLDVEELLDRESAKQAWELDDALRDQPSLLRTLRISVCNTHKNQPAMRLQAASKQADSANGDQDSAQGGADTSDWGSVGTTGTPEWTLHILGDALGVEQGSQKLSDFIEKIEVIFPEDSMQNERQFLWTLEQAGADTFDLKRAGTACDREFDIDITVWCRRSSRRFKARDSVLGEALGLTEPSSKKEFIHAFWTYVKGKRLHDPQDITCIKLDQTLQSVLRIDSFKVSEFASVLDNALEIAPSLPVRIRHRLSLTSAELKPTVVDVAISVASERALVIRDFSKNLQQVDAKLEEIMQQLATKKKKRDFMQACAESPIVFLNQMLDSLNASVQELKRSDLLRLPFAQPLRVGAGCKGQREQELLQEERLSALWDWPGMEKIVMKAMDDKVDQQRRQQKPPTGNEKAPDFDAYNGAAYSAHAEAGRVEQDVQQPKQKKQKKSDDLTKLDPSQALQNLMTGGQINTKPSVNSTPSAEQHSSAGRHNAHHELQAQQMNGNSSSSINLVPPVVSSLTSLQQRSALTMHGGEMPAHQQHASHTAPGAYLQLPSLQEKLSQERREQEQRTLEGQLQLQLIAEQLQLGLGQQFQQQLREQKQTEQQLREQKQTEQQLAQQLRELRTIKEQLKDNEVQKMQAQLRQNPQLEQQFQGNPQMQQQILEQIDRTVEQQLLQIYQTQLQPTNNPGAGSSWAV